MATERRALLVLGMHRSGTSALTRVLNIYGAALPPELLPANSGNVTGYWESPTIVRFNDQVLDAIGSPWDHPVWFSLEALPAEASREHARQLADLIASEFGDAPLIVVKDPRLCRLMPLWQEALALLRITPLPILLLRHPLEAAASMRARDDMPEGVGLLLWLQYVLAAEYASRHLQRALVFYDDLLADSSAIVDGIESRFGMRLPARGAAADVAVAAFLQPSLRHARLGEAGIHGDGDIFRMTRRVYGWFERWRGRTAPSDTRDLDTVRGELAEGEALFGPSLGWRLRREEQRVAHAEALKWEGHLRTSDAVSQDLASRLAAATATDAVLRDQVQRLESRLVAAEADALVSREQATELQRRLAAAIVADAALREQMMGQASHLVAANANEAFLRAQVQDLDSRLAALGAAHGMLSQRIRRIEATLVWRIGSRVRRLQKQLTGGQP